jgi:hypothetical protein
MNRKLIKQIFSVIFFTVITPTLSYLANSSLIFDKMKAIGLIGESIDISVLQDYCLWVGIVLSGLFLSLNLIYTKVKHEDILEQRNSLIKMTKNVLAGSLGRRFLSQSSTFNIRIFVPKHPWLYKIADKLHFIKIKRMFIIKNIDLISDQGITKNLQFEVYPNQEGLVGMCFKEKSVVYDDDLEHTNNVNYGLNQNQKSRTSDLKWSICCPVFENNDTVVAIIALDGKTRITIDKAKETALSEELFVFSRMLFDSVPQLFKEGRHG